MNTVQKGDAFEEVCYNLIKDSLEAGRLGLMHSFCKVFQKKGYYSRDRDSDIIFDLSIEMWLPGANNYTLLYLIECKNYKGKVPVNDVEEFYTKVRQIVGINGKGVFITNKSFQTGGFKFARSKGIMLLTVNNDITLNILLYKAERYRQMQIEEEVTQVTEEDYQNPYIREIVHQRWKRKIDQSIIASFLEQDKIQLADAKDISKNIPILSKQDIEEFVSQLLNSYDASILQEAKSISWPSFINFLSDVYELSIGPSDNLGIDGKGRKLISVCRFTDKSISIDRSVFDMEQFSFLMGHELGHFFLHNKTLLTQATYDQFEDSTYSFEHDRYQINNDRNWLEWQANQFASNLIMPKASIVTRFRIEQDKLGLHVDRSLYVDNQRCNQDSFHTITRNLAFFFKTTKTSVIYRLNDFGLLNFNMKRGYNSKTAGQIIREMYPNAFD